MIKHSSFLFIYIIFLGFLLNTDKTLTFDDEIEEIGLCLILTLNEYAFLKQKTIFKNQLKAARDTYVDRYDKAFTLSDDKKIEFYLKCSNLNNFLKLNPVETVSQDFCQTLIGKIEDLPEGLHLINNPNNNFL